MKIIYVVARPLEINTSASLRNLSTINGLTELGHQVTVVCSNYDEKHPSFDKSIKSKAEKTFYIQTNNIQKIQGLGRNLKILKPLRKFLYKLKMERNIYGEYPSFSNNYIIEGLNIQDFDLIISSSDPKSSHLFVDKLLEYSKKKIPWIQIWGDPFMLDITRKKKNEKKIYMEEKRLISKASKIVYVSPLTQEKQKELYPDYRKKMFFIPIPFVRKEYYETASLSQKKSLNFLYTGDFNSDVRNIVPLIQYISDSGIPHKLIVAGSGDLEQDRYRNVEFKGRISYADVLALEKDADVLVFLSNRKGTQIPGKIYQYSGTNKPILFINDGDGKERIENYFEPLKRYAFCDNTKESIENGILELIKEDQAFVPVKDFEPINVARKILIL